MSSDINKYYIFFKNYFFSHGSHIIPVIFYQEFFCDSNPNTYSVSKKNY